MGEAVVVGVGRARIGCDTEQGAISHDGVDGEGFTLIGFDDEFDGLPAACHRDAGEPSDGYYRPS
ncbi:MAG: hypothetical protein KAY24_04230, partial [Candidatus Eisenbacteria sp.]|nr:hypothetical protein [Candidatus Eisenbacteria bacterium]